MVVANNDGRHFIDVDSILTSNISDLSASTWSQDDWSRNSVIKLNAFTLPLSVGEKKKNQQTNETTMKQQKQNKPSVSRKRSSENPNLNNSSFLITILRMMDFDANKLGSLTLNVLILIGQAVTILLSI